MEAVGDEGSERSAGEASSKVAISVIILEMVVGEGVGDEKEGGCCWFRGWEWAIFKDRSGKGRGTGVLASWTQHTHDTLENGISARISCGRPSLVQVMAKFPVPPCLYNDTNHPSLVRPSRASHHNSSRCPLTGRTLCQSFP